MSHLSLILFGRFQAHLDDKPLPGFRTSKVQALLVYLAAEPDPHGRESLMELLWPGMPERSARHNLRQVLYYLRGAIPELRSKLEGSETKVPPLLTNRQTIQLNPAAGVSVDVDQFKLHIESTQKHDHLDLLSCRECREQLQEAVAIYQGDFLADFYLDDSNEFEDWAQVQREAYRRKALDALEILTTMATRQKDYPQARSLAERQLEIDNLRESSYRQLMEVLALSGRREEALAVYDACRRLLVEELAMEPSGRTTEIYEKILAGALSFDTPQSHGVRGYEIKDEIGEGAYGTIHRAVQPIIGREVAVKVIRRKYANNPEFIRRFEDEAQTIARLEHPFVVPLYDYWRDPEGAYLVMRYLKGGSLLSALEKGPWDSEPTVQLLDQIASALSAAHQMGIVHRDIKPANILLDETGNAYLSDFGIAKGLGTDRPLTVAGAILGTPDYISPEQILDEQVGPRSDLYSLGAVLFETLTGEKPFGDASAANLIYKHLNEPFPFVSDSRPDLPSQLDTVIQKATAKRPADRYENVLEMAEAFRSAGLGIESVEASTAPATFPIGVPLHNPYKGLQAFQEFDAEDFFGRDSLVDRLVARMTPELSSPRHSDSAGRGRFLALVGPSGSGKSSVIKAGLIPALRSSAIPNSEKWFITEMVPGSHPLEELEMALWPIAVDPPPSLVEPMQRDVRGMLRTIRRIMPDEEGAQLLLIIDQFEELFTLVEERERRDFFLESLMVAISAPRTPLRVVITLRADFYDRPLQMQSLGQLLKETTEIILPLSAEELSWAAREPARRLGVGLELGLAEAIVADVTDQPGALPLLQYALTELFERRQGRQMSLAAYQEIGGVQGALGRRANELYGNLETSAQEAARHLFLRLVTLGEGVEDTRRRVLRSEIESIVNSQFTTDHSQLSEVNDAFGAARLLTFDRDPLTRAPTVEVAHEALLREWGRLREWLDESRDDVRLQRQLARAAGEWLGAGHDESYLLRGARLTQLEDWSGGSSVALTRTEDEFLAAGIAAREARRLEEEARQRRELETARQLAETEKARAETESRRAEEQANAARRLRQRAFMLSGVLVVAVILAAAAALFGQDANRNAELAATREAEAIASAELAAASANAEATAAAEALEQKAIAEQQSLVAQSRELAAASANSLSTDPELGILLAMQALSRTDTSEAEQALHSALFSSRVRQRLVGHQAAIQRLAYSPDGSLIALAAYGEDLATLWDAASGRKLHEIPVDRCCWGLYFDDEGTSLAAAESGESFSLAIWDMVTGQKLESFPLPIATSELGGYYLHPDWTQAAVYLQDGALAVWDLQEGEKLFDLPGHAGADWVELEYSKDGRRLVTYDWPGGLVLVWNAYTGELIRQIATDLQVNDHAVSPDGRRVALAADLGIEGDWEVQIWDLDNPFNDAGELSPTVRLTGHEVTIRYIDFSPDGRLVASAGRDGTSRVWDSVTGESLLVLPHASHVRAVVFHPDGRSLLTSDLDGVARVWDITAQGSSERLGIVAHDSGIFDADLSQDGRMLAIGAGDGSARIWDLETGILSQRLDGHTDVVMSVSFHPNGRRVATASQDGTARVWDTATGEELFRVGHHGENSVGEGFWGVLSVDYSPEGSLLATGGADGTARIWNSESGEARFVLEGHTAPVTRVAFSPDGRYLATGQHSGQDLNVETVDLTVRIWDAQTGRELFVISTGHGDSIWGIEFSPDGRFLATSGGDTTAKLWELDYEAGNAKLLETLTSHTDGVIRVRFSPDGRTLTTGSPEETRLWDLRALFDTDGEISIPELLVLPGGHGLFTPDSSEFITAGYDSGVVRVYLLDPDELAALAQERLTRWWTEGECRQYLHTDVCPAAPGG